MHPIQMVDTRRQYNKIKSEVDTAMQNVIDSSMFIGGSVVQNFGSNLAAYNGSRHVIPCANGTDALQIAMMALGLEPGDEVITPSFTYIATVEVVALLRLTPVFAEVEKDTFCIDPDSIRKLITPKTKAIVPVHLYGHAAKMEEIMKIADEFGLYVIEDNAQGIGSDYIFKDGKVKKTGSIGHIGCTSFYPSKNLGAYGDGGAIFTDDDELALKLKMIASHGQSKRYQHDLVGCNSRLDALQAAILDVKLKYLDEYISARRAAADFYDEAFAGTESINTPFRASYCKHVFHQYTLVLEGVNRDALSEYLAKQNVPSMIYYPIPSHRQKMFESFGGASFDLPVTDWLTKRVISLPIHTELDKDQLDYIASTVLQFINT